MQPGDLVAERFEIERTAGSGGMGDVYQARDRLDGQVIALKVLRGARPPEAQRFALEARVLSELHHPAVVKYVAHGVTPRGEMYLAMEWLEGEDLAARLARSRLPLDASITLATRVARALGVAHARGIVHRDIKPANLFLPGGDVERVKILDFGIARFGARTATRTGMTLGTPGYMAPEQARGDRDLDARTDVFALGCVLFECVAGRPAFVGEHVMAVLAKILLDEAPRLSEIQKDVPADLDDLVGRMLAKEPSGRPRDADEIAASLDAIGSLEESSEPPLSVMPPSITRGERRLLSVVMMASGEAPSVDVATAATMLPVQEGEAQAGLRAIVEARGGRFEVLFGGTVVALLSGAGIATDQAAQAARCALAMRAVAPLSPMALTTGRAEVTGRLPVGEAIDRAARMLHATPKEGGARKVLLGGAPRPPSIPPASALAEPIAIDEVTAGLLDVRFDVAGDERGLLLRSEREVFEAARTLLGKPTACIGRERELGMLDGIFAEAVAEPVARAVLVTAGAGVGKSRLRDEFLRKLAARGEALEVWVGRGDPMSAGSAFGLLAQALRRAAGLLDGEPLASRQKKLQARVARHVRPAELARVTEFLGELLGAPFPDDDSVQLRAARRDAMLMGDQMRRAWEDFLLAECSAQPVLLVLEDMHWGDLPTVKFVDAALRNLRDEAFMVLAFARPEVRDLFPDCWAERGLSEMRLGPLTRKASERLVRRVLGTDVSDEVVGRVVDRADGNAFYLEELVRAVAEGKEKALPETVLAMVQARIEGLGVEERRVLRAASVFGQTFWKSGVETLLGGVQQTAELDDWLGGLVEREVLARRGEEKFPGEEEYAFRHGLVREAAYAMLTEGDRQLGHRLAGRWLESVGERDAMTLAEHFERGHERASAATWYRRAAEQALEGNDFAAVLARAERGIACATDAPSSTRVGTGRDDAVTNARTLVAGPFASGAKIDPFATRRSVLPVGGGTIPLPAAPDPRIGALRLLQAEAHRWRGELPLAEQHGLDAMTQIPEGSAPWYSAAAEVVMAASRLGNRARVVETARTIEACVALEGASQAKRIALSRSAPVLVSLGDYEIADAFLCAIESGMEGSDADPTVAAWLATARASRALVAKDPGEFLRQKRAGLAGFEQAGNLRSACNQRVGFGYANLELGAYAEAERALRDALAEAERMGLSGVGAAAKQNLGLALGLQGRLKEGLDVERAALVAFRAHNHLRMEGASRVYIASMLVRDGALPEAEDEARAAVLVLSTSPPFRAFALAALAEVLIAQGRGPEALGAAQEAIALLNELGAIEEGESLVRLVYAEALHATGAEAEARAALREARDHLQERAARISDAELRASFLERVPENARTTDLCARWLG